MDVRELIKEVRRDNRIVRHKEEEIERLKSRCHVAGVSFEGERVSGSHNNSRVEDAILNYIAYKDKLKDYIAAAIVKRDQLQDMIDQLGSEQEISVMYKYCLGDLTLLQIADVMDYSKPAVYKIYSKAVDKMQARVNESRQK